MGANETYATGSIFESTECLTLGKRELDACRYEEARQAFARALELVPDSIDALRGLGYSLFQLRQLAESLEMLERALQMDPTDLLSRLLMGRLCLRLQQPGGAIEHFRAILQRIENSAAARSGLIDAYLALGQLAEADALCGEILRAEPQSEVGHLSAARLAGFKRDDELALRHFESLVQMRPNNVAHRYNRGLCLLRMGRFDEGWRDYEFRFAAGAVNLRLPSTPRWDGERVSRLLVVAEQGLGDALLFSRFVADAARKVDQLTLVCPDSMVELLNRSLGCPCVCGPTETWPQHDAHVPLMSLPYVLGLGADAAAQRPAYLKVDAARRERWASAIGPRGNTTLRIGLVHATSAAHSTEENPWTRRSCRAADLLPILQSPGIEAYDLNPGDAAEQARRELPGLRELPARVESFDDTAALIGVLDAVVSVDTACAHVAGAVGAPLFLLLPPAPDWKWRQGARGAPWYETAHLISRSSADRWIDVAEQALKCLQLQVGARAPR